jgi:hypothetical protein
MESLEQGAMTFGKKVFLTVKPASQLVLQVLQLRETDHTTQEPHSAFCWLIAKRMV